LTIALGTLWQPLCDESALGLCLEEAAEEEEEAEVGGNQLLSLHSSSSPSLLLPIYESWGCSPASSKEKETRPTPS